jgi:hypothetical protein
MITHSWFVLAESRFRLQGIHREQTRYDYLVSALTKEAVSLVLDVVEHPPERLPYSALKQRLLDSHQLSDYQWIAMLHKMVPLDWPLCLSCVLEAMRCQFSSLIFSRRRF